MKEICLLTLFFSPVLASATNYYVNDASLAGDIYCSSVGNTANNGMSVSSPKNSVQAIISTYTLSGGDVVYIDAGTYTEDVSISGLSGAGTLINFRGAGAALTLIQGIAGGANPYTLQLVNSSYLKWTGITVTAATGEWSTRVFDNSDYNEFSNCTMNGLYGFDFINMFGGGTPDYNSVYNCIVNSSYVGIRFKWGASYNEVYDTKVLVVGTGPNVFGALEFQAATNNLAYRNVLSCTGKCDEGTVHSGQWASGNVLTNNYILNLTAPSGSSQNPAIEVDDDAGLSLIHNSVYSVGPAFHMDPLTGVTTETNMVVRNNIFYSTASDCISLTQNTSKFGTCDNNLYYAPAGNVANTGGTTRNLASWKTYDPDIAALNEVNGLYGDPLYSAAATNNLDLSSVSSAAANKVVNVIPSVTIDIYKSPRPEGPAPEIGAYEFVPLPVKWLNFSTDCNSQGVLLTWATTEEENNHSFVVENSEDAIHFATMGSVKGKGNSTALTTYEYLDTLGHGNYYRLKQTDENGMSTYSEIIHLNCNNEKAPEISAWNNGQYLLLSLSSSAGEECVVTLYSVTGQIIFSETRLLSKGHPILSFVVPELASGCYLVQVVKEGKVFSTKVLF